MLGNSFGRMIGLDGRIAIENRYEKQMVCGDIVKWLTIAENLLKGLPDVKKYKCLIIR